MTTNNKKFKLSTSKKSIRHMPPATRKLAKLIREMESLTRRAKNLLPEYAHMESLATAPGPRQKPTDRQLPDDWHQSGIGTQLKV